MFLKYRHNWPLLILPFDPSVELIGTRWWRGLWVWRRRKSSGHKKKTSRLQSKHQRRNRWAFRVVYAGISSFYCSSPPPSSLGSVHELVLRRKWSLSGFTQSLPGGISDRSLNPSFFDNSSALRFTSCCIVCGRPRPAFSPRSPFTSVHRMFFHSSQTLTSVERT